MRFPAVATLAPLLPRVSSWRRRVPLALFLAALAALSLALARPHATVAVPQEQASIVLVTDVSRSMLAEDVDPSRLDAARSAALRFLDEVPDAARVGAVAFSTDPHTREAPTDDRGEVEDLIGGLSADGGTATGDALAAALDMVDDGPAAERPPAAILLLSDGETTTGRDPTDVARAARKLRIPIHTVALGTERRDDRDPHRRDRPGAARPGDDAARSPSSPAAAPSRPRTPTTSPASTRTWAPGWRRRRKSERSRSPSRPAAASCWRPRRPSACGRRRGCPRPPLTDGPSQ